MPVSMQVTSIFVTLWTVACKIPLSIGFSRQRLLEWVCMDGIFPTQWCNLCLLCLLQLSGGFFTTSATGSIILFKDFRFWGQLTWTSFQFSLVAQSCPTLCNPMNRSMPGLPVHHQLPEFTQTHVRVHDAIQPFHPLSSLSPSAPNPFQHQTLFQWVNSSHEVANVLEFQL